MRYIIILTTLLSPLIQWTHANECACATGSVNVRTGAGTSHAIIDTMRVGQCVPFTGHLVTAGGLHWASVQYEGKQGWVASNWLTFKPTCDTGSTPVATTASSSVHSHTGNTNDTGCPRIITRAEWGARNPTHYSGNMAQLPIYVFIHHGATASCHTESECSDMVRSYQRYHMDYHGWPDIGYSFVVGEDGNVYEARGWEEIGAHTYGHNHDGLGICIIGNFMTRVPNDAALNAVKQLIQCGLDNGHISSNYTLKGHRDVGQTDCPGDMLWQLIHGWSHYKQNRK